VYVITKSVIVFSAQFDILIFNILTFPHIICSWSKIRSPCRYVSTVGFCILHCVHEKTITLYTLP